MLKRTVLKVTHLYMFRAVAGHYVKFFELQFNVGRWSIRLIEGPLSLPYDPANIQEVTFDNLSESFICQVHICALYAAMTPRTSDVMKIYASQVSYKAILRQKRHQVNLTPPYPCKLNLDWRQMDKVTIFQIGNANTAKGADHFYSINFTSVMLGTRERSDCIH